MAVDKRPRTDVSDRHRRTSQFSGVQVMFAAILSIGMILAINFSSRIASSQPLQEAYNRAVIEIERLRQEQAELIRLRDYVRSDAYVANWARSDGKMVRPGEVLVVPVPSGVILQPTPVPPPFPQNLAQESSPAPQTWTLWWALFFDSPPPDLGF